MLFLKNWKQLNYWNRYKASFKKNPISHLILLFVGSQVLIAVIATIVFLYTGLGLLSKALGFFTLCLIVAFLIVAVILLIFFGFLKLVVNIAEAD